MRTAARGLHGCYMHVAASGCSAARHPHPMLSAANPHRQAPNLLNTPPPISDGSGRCRSRQGKTYRKRVQQGVKKQGVSQATCDATGSMFLYGHENLKSAKGVRRVPSAGTA